MKTKIILLLSIIQAFAVLGKPMQLPDSLLTEAHIRSLLVEAPDSALTLIDAAVAAPEPLADFRAELLRSLTYHELHLNSLQERHARLALECDSIVAAPKLRLNALTLLAEAEELNGRYRQAIATWTEALALARGEGNRPAEMLTLASMAKTFFAMGDRAEGFRYLDEVISGGEKSDNVRELANVSYALGVKVLELYADDRYDEAVAEGWRRMRLVGKIEAVGGCPPGYPDQQRAYTWARLASSSLKAGDRAAAEEAYRGFNSTDFGKTVQGAVAIVDYLLDTHRWTEILAVTTPYASLFEGPDTISDGFRSVLVSQAAALRGLGRADEAYVTLRRAMVVNDSLTAREKARGVREMAAMFNMVEKERELASATAAAQRHRDWLVAGAALLVLLIIIAGLLWRNWRSSSRRHKLAAERVGELEEERQALTSRIDTMVSTPVNYLDEKERFAALETLVRERRLFLDPGCDRKMLASEAGMTQQQIVALIRRYTGDSAGSWLTKLKMEYAVELMERNPEWTMEAISQELGYASRSTFYQNFNKYYGMTPAEYHQKNIPNQ